MTEENQGQEQRVFSTEQKFKIVKEALTTDLGVSGVCRKYGVSAGAYYKWQEKFFLGAKEGLERKTQAVSSKELRTISAQEQKISRMQNVIAEITAENIELKKNLGEL
jgi:transposase-like protein